MPRLLARYRPIMFRRAPRARPRRGLSLAVRLLILTVVMFIIICVVFSVILNQAKPMIKMLAEAQAREYVLTAVAEAVRDEIAENGVSYEDLVTLTYNDSGEVTSLVTDMAKINTMQSNVSSRAARLVVNLINTDLTIHLGDVTNNLILSGRGPKLPVRVQSVTSVSARAVNEFGDAGINQTHHRIVLEVSVDVNILMPGGVTTTEIKTDVTMAESIIVGKVPGIYSK